MTVEAVEASEADEVNAADEILRSGKSLLKTLESSRSEIKLCFDVLKKKRIC